MPHIAAAARASRSAASILLGPGTSAVPTEVATADWAAIAATAEEMFVVLSGTMHLVGILPVLLALGRLRRIR